MDALQHITKSDRQRTYRIANLDKVRKQEATRRRRRRVKNQEKSRTYRSTHRKTINLYERAYHKKHPEKKKEMHASRRAHKFNAPVNDCTAGQWQEIKAAYGYHCVYCGTQPQRLTQDHITPLSKGGSHTASNIVPACRSCNSKKYTGNVLIPVQPLLLTIATAKGV